MNIKTLITSCIVLSSLSAVAHDYTRGLSIWFDRPCDLNSYALWNSPGLDHNWENNSLPIGNGSIGACITGSVAAERITLNEKTLWRGGPNTRLGADYYWNVNKQSAHLLTDIRKAFYEGDKERAAELTRNNFNGIAAYDDHSEQPFRFGSFTSMGEMYIETGLSEIGMDTYSRALSLDSALCVVSFNKDGVNYERKSFVSYPDSALVMRYTADKPACQSLTLRYAPTIAVEGKMQRVSNNEALFIGSLRGNDMKYAVRIRAFHKGGSLDVTKDGYIVTKDADEVVFVVTADTDYKINFDPDFSNPETYVGVNPEYSTKKMMDAATAYTFDELCARHKADYTSLFNRVKLSLNPNAPITMQYPAVTDMPTYKRLARYREGHPDYQLEEIYYQYGRYLLIASSRKGNMPANLQGIWANGIDAPWHADYHNNINIQMNYWPVCSANLEECAEPMFDFIRTLEKPGTVTAKSYFGARGWTASISANIFGFTSPLSSTDMSWNFSPMAGPWLATHLWEYYDYTRDISFLRKYYNLIKTSAQFAVDHLWHRSDGTYTAAPSTSPEHGPIDSGATFAHAVVLEILNDAIEASKVLKCDVNERKQWQHVINNLAPYKIGRYGQLMEWSEDIDDPKDEHRHVNHLFGLFPGHTISPLTTPALAEASKVVLEHRGDGATGWSMGWKLNLWAHLLDGNHSYKLFRNLLSNGTLDNLWDSHPPFQIDGNFGGTSGITEMLMQSENGTIHLLPAIPDIWSEGSVVGLRARGNFTIDIVWKEGKLESAIIHSGSGGKCNLHYEGNNITLKTKKGHFYRIYYNNGIVKAKEIK